MPRWVRRVTLCVLLSARVVAAQPGWQSATDLYLVGQAEAALQMIATLPRAEVRDGALEIVQKGQVGDRRRALALVALWTEVQVETWQGVFTHPNPTPDPSWPRLVCRWQGTWGDAALSVKIYSGPTLIELAQQRWAPDLDFLEAWYALVIAHHQAGDGFHREDCFQLAPAAVRRKPTLLLSLARHQENAWFFAREANRKAPLRGDLGLARDALETALKVDPTLDEARLRLGRVQAMTGRLKEAITTLHGVQAPMEPKFVYLARLFEADIYEAGGDPERALEAYQAAAFAYPGGHSARIGWARLARLLGRGREASTALQQWAVMQAQWQAPEPWAEYYYGFEGQLQRYRERLRMAVLAEKEQ